MNEIREAIIPSTPIDTSDIHAIRTSVSERAQPDVYARPITRSQSQSVDAARGPTPPPPASTKPASRHPAAPEPVARPATPIPARRLILERPIVAFDLETTGLNRTRDAIIEWGAVKEWPTGKRQEYLFRIKPRVPVQPTAERIHGISNEALADCETFDKVAPKIAAVIDGSDLLGHNARAFDLPFLTIEMTRVGREDCLAGARVVDTLRTFRKAVPKGKGTDNHRLGTAFQYYFHKPLDGAHGALADARASLDVLHAQLNQHPELPNTVEALAALEA